MGRSSGRRWKDSDGGLQLRHAAGQAASDPEQGMAVPGFGGGCELLGVPGSIGIGRGVVALDRVEAVVLDRNLVNEVTDGRIDLGRHGTYLSCVLSGPGRVASSSGPSSLVGKFEMQRH